MLHGSCHSGAIQFEVSAPAAFSTVCHCNDCRRQSGAPFLAWAMVPVGAVSVQGEPRVYGSSASGKRSFCPVCGTGLFFTNAPLAEMGMMQVRIAALDDPNAIEPKAQVQTAERISWMTTLDDLPSFDRFPG